MGGYRRTGAGCGSRTWSLLTGVLACVGLTSIVLQLNQNSSYFVHLPDGRRYLPRAVEAHEDDHTATKNRKRVKNINLAVRRMRAGRSEGERNCSVVGNDSSMRRAGLGAVIDSAQAVYRMNFGPLKEFGQHVGMHTYTQCINPEKLRLLVKNNPNFELDTGEKPRVMVVGDAGGSDPVTGNKGPCVGYSPGGTCVSRVDNPRPHVMDKRAQDTTEKLLDTLQEGHEGESVPSTGLYCLVLALMECSHVNVYGMGVGTINHNDLSDLEYFKDPHFHGWDARHDMELERTLMRILSSEFWSSTPLTTEGFGSMHWHNPLQGVKPGANDGLVAVSPCTSGIHC